ncbi:hypothetical protein G6F64_004306 [Rhizopus arrhizus]|uniref:Uncharacterized protein n=1 Tax=Rhizopus oryzae TaxID=64495 RepID=A0A9P7BUC9_RHIOR|nr:hypothetical protein G6F24_005732 [Rhizopus arrhizus]KAG1310786.1 hypothetical protein G6F64_004306 [Rhizopus arrhizus]
MNTILLYKDERASVVGESGNPEPMDRGSEQEEDIPIKETNTQRDHVRYTVQDKVRFLDLKIKGCTSASANQLGIHVRTAQRGETVRCVPTDSMLEHCEKVGRKSVLTKEHKTTVINFTDINLSATVVEVTEHVLKRFNKLKVSRSAVYHFMRGECNLSLKKADFHPIEGNSSAKDPEAVRLGLSVERYRHEFPDE